MKKKPYNKTQNLSFQFIISTTQKVSSNLLMLIMH
jgi:hypothetical protein